jgi:predicted DNA-binding protein (MmcQ/YjbR family)
MNVSQAQAHCATLPGATLDHKWRFEDSVHPVYSVGGRMFAMFSMKAGKLQDTIMFKADDARFLELTDRPGIAPMPYLARAKWVKVEGVRRLSDAELTQLIGEAHALILAKSSKKKQAAILAGAGTASPATKKTATAKKPGTAAKSATTKMPTTATTETVKIVATATKPATAKKSAR